MFVELIFSTLKIQVGDCLNPMENPVFQYPVSAFHSVKPGLKNMFCWQDILLILILREGGQTQGGLSVQRKTRHSSRI